MKINLNKYQKYKYIKEKKKSGGIFLETYVFNFFIETLFKSTEVIIGKISSKKLGLPIESTKIKEIIIDTIAEYTSKIFFKKIKSVKDDINNKKKPITSGPPSRQNKNTGIIEQKKNLDSILEENYIKDYIKSYELFNLYKINILFKCIDLLSEDNLKDFKIEDYINKENSVEKKDDNKDNKENLFDFDNLALNIINLISKNKPKEKIDSTKKNINLKKLYDYIITKMNEKVSDKDINKAEINNYLDTYKEINTYLKSKMSIDKFKENIQNLIQNCNGYTKGIDEFIPYSEINEDEDEDEY